VSRKVLIINLEFPPVGGPGVQRVLKFVRYLPKEGWAPTVICGDKSTWHDWRDDSLLREVPDDVDVFRLSYSTIDDYSALASIIGSALLFPLYPFLAEDKVKGGLRRKFFSLFRYMHPEPLLSWVYLATKKAVRSHRKNNFDVALTSGPPHVTHLVGLMLKRHYHLKWVADFRDPWVDRRAQADRMGISRRLDRLWQRLVVENADRIISVSPSWTKLLSRKLSGPEEARVQVVYNGYDPDDIPYELKPINPEPCSDFLCIHYNGTIQGATLPSLFFKALAELRKEELCLHKNLRCTFTGLPSTVADLANDLGLNGIIIDVGKLSHRESLQMAVNSDVLLLIVNNADETTNGVITAKVYEYVAMGKNILAIIPQSGDLHAFLKDYRQCHIVGWDNLGGMIEMVKLLMAKKRNGQLNSYDPPSWIEQYSRRVQTGRLAKILEGLVWNGS
jgi:hypothetical protein